MGISHVIIQRLERFVELATSLAGQLHERTMLSKRPPA